MINQNNTSTRQHDIHVHVHVHCTPSGCQLHVTEYEASDAGGGGEKYTAAAASEATCVDIPP